jgi:hypothetical protein
MSEGGEGVAGPALTQDEYTDAVLRHGRYVDAHGMPVGYNQPAPFAEFKIMPFEMRLVIDQRKISDLLSNCANSPLPVEVQQVSIVSTETPLDNVGGSDEGRPGMPGMPGMQGGMNRPMMNRGMMDGEGGMPGGGRGMPTRPTRTPMGGEGGDGPTDLGSALELRPFDLHVEVRGVIYIFNYPDRSKVGKAEPAPEVQSDEAAEATDAAEAGAGG